VDEAVASRDAALEAIAEGLTDARARVRALDTELEARGEALSHAARHTDHLERVASRLAERVVERERELTRLRSELARLHELERRSVRSLTAFAEDMERVREQARGQATRMRLQALREAIEISERFTELSKRPGEVRERLIESLQEAIRRIGTVDDEAEATAPVPARRASGNGHVAGVQGDLFEGTIEVEIGPLSDFSQLVGFEDAAGAIAATSEISVKRFTQGRATLQMHLREPVELLRELEERAPFEFRVRDQRSGRITLDVDDE
jgi:hypothetical protein